MRRLMPRVLLAFACLGWSAHAWSYFDKGGVLGVGARPMGMGGAFVAVQDAGTDAIWWNPAGLVTLPQMQASALFGPLLNGKEIYYSGAFATPFMDDTALGLELTDLYYNTGETDTDSSEYQAILSVATPLNVEKTVSVGLNLKFDQVVSNASAQNAAGQSINNDMNGLGLDVGALYQVPLPTLGKQVNFGFLGQDLDTVLHDQSSGVDTTVPLLLQFGTAYYPTENLVFTCDFSFFNDLNIAGEPLTTPLYDADGDTITSLAPDQSRPHFGIEGWFFDGHLGLRAGYTGFATTPDQFTAGVSYRQSWYGVDYAYMGHADYLGDSHRLEVHFNFGGPAERPRVVSLVNPPTNVVAQPDNNRVLLTWTPNPDPHVTGYTIYMSKASGTDYTPVQKRMTDHKVVVDGLTNGVRYYFVVVSVNNSWPAVESVYSGEVSAVPSPQIPGAPVLGGAAPAQSQAQGGEIEVKGWGYPLPSTYAGYNLYMSTDPAQGFAKVNLKGLITTPSYTVQGLDINRRYYFKMTGVNNDTPPVESGFSPVWSMLSHEIPAQQPAPAAGR